jgi:hypothetical protein
MNPNAINYYNLMSLMNCNEKHANPLRSCKFNNFFDKKIKWREFKEGDLITMFDA